MMFYFYVLLSLRDGNFYIGFTNNLKIRVEQHKKGKVKSTSKRLPVKLIYYESYLKNKDARRNEKDYKTT